VLPWVWRGPESPVYFAVREWVPASSPSVIWATPWVALVLLTSTGDPNWVAPSKNLTAPKKLPGGALSDPLVVMVAVRVTAC
jgi:hypothetical protein